MSQEGLSASQVMILAPHRPQTLGLREGELIGPWPVNIASDWWDVAEAGQVNFGTVHGFKGLEADVVIYLAPGYRHPDAERLAYTAYSRARHRLVVLEKAIAQPVRPKQTAEATKVQASKPAGRPSFQHVPTYSDEQRAFLMSALTAAKAYKPISNG
jgi:superfamily I DNA/RNA helicase